MRSIPKTWVREGGMVQLSKKHLKAEYKGASDSEILYTIQSDSGQPQYGTTHSTAQEDKLFLHIILTNL